MANQEPVRWITVNGKHIPIYEGEDNSDALKRAFGKKNVKVGDKDVEVKERKKRVNQEDLTNEKIMEEIAGKDSFANTEEYKKAAEEAGKNWKLQQEINEKRRALEKELEAETSEKPEEEWDDTDAINALLMGKHSVKKYTEKGEKMKTDIEGLRAQYREAEGKWQKATDKIQELGKGERERQKQAFLNRDDSGDISTNLKDDYFGFAKDETTTPYIDEMLKNGKAHVVEMSPKRYIEECAYNIFNRESSTIESTIRGRNAKDVAKYMTMMEEGVKFDTPYLNYKDEQQEGLHRAIAAYMLGIEKMPVVIVPKKR